MDLKRIFVHLEVDRSVLFGLLAKAWSFCSGPITVFLIASRLTPQVQGFYYTFSTLLTLQVFLQLGLGTVVSQFASHEWANLEIDENGTIVGNNSSLSRLASIANIAFRWYIIIGIIFFILISLGGYVFFSTSNPSKTINWEHPWILLCFMEGLSVCLVPVWSILEGCNQVVKLYRFRFYQGMIISITIWVALVYGASLWTAAFSVLVYILTSIYFIKKYYFAFFISIKNSINIKLSESINWKVDMLPMQWRVALSWISGYFIFSLFVPILFKYSGPEIAGQMGMTWTLIVVLGSVSSSWLSPKTPIFGMLIAKKDYVELDKVFWKTTKIVIYASLVLALFILTTVILINNIEVPFIKKFANRLLPPLPTGIFLIAQLIYIASTPFATYLRAHKKEPLMIFSIIYAIFVALSTIVLGKYFSVIGMACGYLVVNIIFIPSIFIIWKKKKMIWHSNDLFN